MKKTTIPLSHYPGFFNSLMGFPIPYCRVVISGILGFWDLYITKLHLNGLSDEYQ